MDPITRRLVETVRQITEQSEPSPYIPDPNFPIDRILIDRIGGSKKRPEPSYIPDPNFPIDRILIDRIGGSKKRPPYIPDPDRIGGSKERPKPTPGKTPYDDRAGDTSVDAANDPARGGQSGAWGGGAGTPAPEPKPPTFGQHSMEDLIRPATPRKPSPYDKIL